MIIIIVITNSAKRQNRRDNYPRLQRKISPPYFLFLPSSLEMIAQRNDSRAQTLIFAITQRSMERQTH
ncbi:hypothetical protein HMPREF1569_4953 [Klebsiella oxytoca OK-1]|nr:hypothetical protein HMPREF1569_4953 [Klebsiella oxytoca OK-1]